MHHTQKSRRANIQTIQKWISEIKDPKSIDQDGLARKCQLILGCTKRLAYEYIAVVLGE